MMRGKAESRGTCIYPIAQIDKGRQGNVSAEEHLGHLLTCVISTAWPPGTRSASTVPVYLRHHP
jgi:hypothetical protein